jgi:hypothetical protein
MPAALPASIDAGCCLRAASSYQHAQNTDMA